MSEGGDMSLREGLLKEIREIEGLIARYQQEEGVDARSKVRLLMYSLARRKRLLAALEWLGRHRSGAGGL